MIDNKMKREASNIIGYLRRAELTDCDMIFEWANDSEVRKQSFSTDKIEYLNHVKWFQSKIEDDHHDFFIYMIENSCVGQVRVDRKENVGKIGFSISKEFRNSGYGRQMLVLLEKEYDPGFCLEGEVKFDNKRSQQCFESLGYQKILKDDCLIYKKEL